MGTGRFITAFISLTILLISIDLKAQSPDIISGFSLRVSPGILSFHGDMSANKYNPFAIIKENSKMGFTLSAIKEFNPIIGVQAQYTAGNLYSIRSEDNLYFTGSVGEFSVSSRLTPLGFFPNIKNRFNLQPYLTFGLGSFGYRSCKRYIDTEDIVLPCYGYENDGTTRTSRKNGLVLPFGLGLSIPINKNLSIDLDHTYRLTNTDLVDATMGVTGRNDWYSLSSIGLRFTLQAPKQSSSASVRSITEPTINKIDHKTTEKIKGDQAMNIFVESLMDDVVSSGDVFAVNLRVNKGEYNGPAKLFQRFPEGFTALEASSTNGRFSFGNRNVLIEWDNMPADSMISFTYYVRIEKDVEGSQTITGRFEYEENDKWNTVRFNNYIFADISSHLDNINLKTEEALDENADQEQLKTENVSKEKTEDDPIVKNPNIDPLILKDPIPDIEFRIQCGAFKDSDQGGSKLVEKYGITENVREVLENGWYKYTVGSFDSYVDAVNYKNSFIKRTKLYSAFIVAYKNGKRVQNINDAFR